MRILADTNVILDVLLKRQDFYKSSLEIFHLAEAKRIKAFVSSSSVTDIYYMLQKQLRNKEQSLEYIKKLLSVFHVAKTDSKSIRSAVSLNWADFEDSVQYSAALRNSLKCIITRNTRDFVLAEIPVYTPEEFLSLIK